MASLGAILAEIAAIDRAINANRLAPPSPDRESRERDLFRQRGDAQLRRDAALDEQEARTARHARKAGKAGPCPTCGKPR